MSSRPPLGTSWVLFKVFGQGDMKEFQNDFWYSVSSGSVSPGFDYHGMIGAFYGALSAVWKNALTLETALRGAIGYFNDGTGTIGAEYYLTVVGTQTDTPLPEDVSAIVRKQTADLRPGGQGRWYFSMVPESTTDGSYLTPTGISSTYAPLAVQLKAAVTHSGVTLSPAHWSEKLNALIPLNDTPVVGLLGTRRRRRGPF